MVQYSYGRFDDLAIRQDVQYISPSRPSEPDIMLPGLRLSDTPDDLLVLEDAVLCQGGGIIWRDLWLSASIHYMPDNWRDASWLPGRMTSDGLAINMNPDCIQISRTIEEPSMLIDSGVGSYNFGHSMHDSMPYGLLFQRARALIPGLLPFNVPFKFTKQSQIFNIVFDCPSNDRPQSAGAIRFKQLVLARRQSVMNQSDGQIENHWYMPFAGLRHVRSAAYAALIPEESGASSDKALKVFLHRVSNVAERRQSGLLQGRNFVNHYELFESLMEKSFVLFEPGWMPLVPIVQMLANTKLAVGVHGAQCANLVFCQPGTRVFEIRGYPGNWRSIEALCGVLGHHFTPLQQSSPVDPDAPKFDIDRILSAMSS